MNYAPCSNQLARFSVLKILFLIIVGCCSLSALAADNRVLPVTVTGHSGSHNRMFVSVTLCAPGTNDCETIDNVMLDTGSIGLRIQSSALEHPERFKALMGPGQQPLAECLRFLSSKAWGKVTKADVKLAGVTAKNMTIQIIDKVGSQDDITPRPSSCLSTSKPTANGTMGIGPGHPYDCKGPCQIPQRMALYYECSNGECVPMTGPVAEQYRVMHPIAVLPGYNNGYVIDIDDAAVAGSASVNGKLILGIDAQDWLLEQKTKMYPNNRGLFDTTFNGVNYPHSYFDTGTEDLYFASAPSSLQQCGHIWCADQEVTLNAQVTGSDGTTVNVPFRVANTQHLRAGAIRNSARVNNEDSGSFVWGAPFFIGKRVYVGIVPLNGGADAKPFYAF